jgi:hypothetical protein
MTTLDTLARRSANALHTSVADVRTPVLGIAGAVHAAVVWRMVRYAVAGATAGAAVVLVLLIGGPAQNDPAENIVPTTSVVVPTSVPESVITPTTPPEIPTEEKPAVAAVPRETEDEPVEEAEDIDPPFLEVTSPRDGEHVVTSVVVFTGQTEPGASVVASGKFHASVEKDGRWSVSLVLAPGANGVRFVASDAVGNETEVRLTVHLDVEVPEETTTTTSAIAEFTANQKYGSCSEPVPFDVFSGKAEPGTTVTVSSPHGGGSTTVDAEGKWSVKIEFPSAPYNEQFTVAVTDSSGVNKTFPFTSYYEG